MKSSGAIPPFPTRRRKISVEVYFVLYLSAIVLLLGTTNKQGNREEELEEAIVQLLAPDFRVDAEKVALIYRFIPAGLAVDTAGVRLNRDSMNVISARGSFSEVEFRIVAIQDTATGQQLPVESATLAREGDRAAIFTWRPREMTDDAIYRVTVAATAVPLPPANIMRPEIRARIAEVLRRHTVSDSVSFTVNVFAVSNLAMLRDAQMPPTNLPRDTGMQSRSVNETLRTVIPQPGEIATPSDFRAMRPTVPAVPRGRWENMILASGVTNATVTTKNAQISMTTPGVIEVTGIAPAVGEQQVMVEAIRSDGKRVTTQFTVNARELDNPKLPPYFYPGENYSLDFTSEGVPSADIGVDVFQDNRKIIDRRNVSARFNLPVKGSGELVFVRYVGDQEMGKFTVEIVPLPPPSVSQPEWKGDEAILRTVSYGNYRNQKNLAELKISVGNAGEPELISTQTNESEMKHTRTWRIRRLDDGKEFSFDVYALDQRGSGTGKSKVFGFKQQ